MAHLNFKDTGDSFDLPDGSPLQEACEEAGVPFACTEGICGTCVIEVLDGMENLSPFNQAEEDFLGKQGCERLACQCRIHQGNVTVKF